MRRRGVGWPDAGVLLASALWGLNFTAVKVTLLDLSPLVLGLLRFSIATILLFLLLVLLERGVGVARRDAPRLAVMGMLSITINQILFLDGMHRTSASIGAIMFACASAFIILLAMLLGERAGPRLWAGVGLATTGIVLIVGVGRVAGGPTTVLGDAEVFFSALAVGLSSLLARGVLRRYSALRVAAWTALCGLLCLTPFALGQLTLVRLSSVHAQAWQALAFTSVGASVVTIVLWNNGLAHVGITRATVYGYLQPVLGVIFAAVLLGDHLTPRQLLGGAVALIGTSLASMATFARMAAPTGAVAAPPTATQDE